MEIKETCPLGAECEEIKDNQMQRCAWYVCLKGKDPQSEKEIDEWKCSMAWMPIMLIENAQTNRGQTQAIESLRNETKSGQEIFNKIISEAIKSKKMIDNL